MWLNEAKLCETHPTKVPRTQETFSNNASNSINRKRTVEPSNEPVPSNSSIPGDGGTKQQDVGDKGLYF